MSNDTHRADRVRAVLAGRRVDPLPFTVWYHFGLQHASPERVAQAHVEFVEAYDLDWLKVMNDYPYPMPAGVETVTDVAQLEKLTPLDMEATGSGGRFLPGDQLRAISILKGDLGGRILFFETVFNAWYTLKRNIVKGFMMNLMEAYPEALDAALKVVNDNLIRYALAALDGGASGVFLAVPGSPEILSLPQYERFMKPYDMALLEAVRDRGEGHLVHVHGDRPYFDQVSEYPVQAISWSDREGVPGLAEACRRTSKALVGGIDHAQFVNLTAETLREQVRRASRETGDHPVLLAPGCAIPSYAFPELIRACRSESVECCRGRA